MKKEDFYEVLGDVDESAVKEAEQQPPKIKRHWGGIALATAACICAVLAAGIMLNLKDTAVEKEGSSYNTSEQDSGPDTSKVPEWVELDIYAYQNGKIIKQTQNLLYEESSVFCAWLKLNGLAEGQQAEEYASQMHFDGDMITPPDRSVTNPNSSSQAPGTSSEYKYDPNDAFRVAYVTVPEEFKEFYNKIPKQQLDKSLMLTLQSYAMMETEIDEIEYTFISKAERESMQASAVIYSYKNGSIKEEKAHISENSPRELFDAWKKSNGIGDEVKLTECDDKTIYGDDSSVSYKLRLTISAELDNYYDRIPKEKLLETLEKTLRYNLAALDDYKVSIADK